MGRETCCHYNWEVMLLEHEMLKVMEKTVYEIVFRSSCCEQNCYIELQVSLLFADLFKKDLLSTS